MLRIVANMILKLVELDGVVWILRKTSRGGLRSKSFRRSRINGKTSRGGREAKFTEETSQARFQAKPH